MVEHGMWLLHFIFEGLLFTFSKLQEKMLHFEMVARVRVNKILINKQINTYVRIQKNE